MPVASKAAAPVRSTQSFVGTLSACWTRPSLTWLEVLWRWVFGVPVLWLLATKLKVILLAATDGTLDPARLGLDKALLNDPVGALTADPMGAAGKLARAIGLVLPGIEHVVIWLAPLLLAIWVVVSSLGRTAVLRRADERLLARPVTVMGLQAIRMVALAAVFLLWCRLVAWSSGAAVGRPIAAGQEPNLVGLSALVIVLTLGMFIAWATVSWWFGMAPVLAMRNGTGVIASLRDAGRLTGLKGQLVEINLVMGIVKIALIVLAMVFSATPLPFQTVTTPEFLTWWWSGVAVLYLVGSDFFHVARLVAYLTLWQTSVATTGTAK